MNGGEDDLFGRWSRRKQAVRRLEAEQAARAAEVESTGADADRQSPEAEPVELVEPPPSLDDLTADGDLSAFLRKGVSTALRNAAMRKMWSLDPAIRDHVGLAENAWDFNQPGAMRGFGPLEAGRAVADFLSAVSREALADPEVATDAPPVAIGPASPPPERLEELSEAPEAAPPAAGTTAIESAEGSESGDPCPEPPRRRHGGAVPR